MDTSSISNAIQEVITIEKGQEFLRQFFVLYKSQPCLWKRSFPNYTDEFKTNLAMMKLTKVYKEIYPFITPDIMKTNLSYFKQHILKQNTEVWYYNDLWFLFSSYPNTVKVTPIPNSLPTIKNKDKFDILAEELRSIPTERFNSVENVITTLIKLKITNGLKRMDTSSISDAIQEVIIIEKGQEFLRQFFVLYKSQPCLWKQGHPNYTDEFERNLAMMKLTKVYKEVCPLITPDIMKTILTYFKQQILEQYSSGYILNSAVWYSNDLWFLYLSYPNTVKMTPIPNSLPAIKSTGDVKDKFDILAEELRSLLSIQ